MEPCCADLNGTWTLAFKNAGAAVRKAELKVVQTENNLEGTGVLHPAEVTQLSGPEAAAPPAPRDINVSLKGTRDGANLKVTLLETKDQKQLFSGEGAIDSVHEKADEKKHPFRVHMSGKGSLPDNSVAEWESIL
jgi:hypothetical protein